MNKIRRIKSLTSILALSSAGVLAASCQSNQVNTVNYPTDKAASDNKIVLATAQSEVYPLTMALKSLVPLYNEQMKNEPGFVKVEFQPSEITKVDSELGLTSQNENYIKSNSDKLANLLLGNQTTAYVINKYGKILDTSSVLSPSDFPEKILKAHNQLVGEQLSNNKIYNLPFDISDTNGFSVNIDLLNKALDLAKEAGATVDKTGKFFEYLEAQKDKGNKIPESSAINFLKVKPDSLKGYTINEKTFKGLNGLFEFARKLKSALEVDQAKVQAYGDKKIMNLQVFSIDYQQDEFLKSLNNQLKTKKLWELEKTNGKFDFSKVKYNIKNDQQIQKVFKDTFDQFVKENSSTVVQQATGGSKNPTLFRDVKYENNVSTDGEWASWHMRQYQTIFAVVASVGLPQSIDSPISRGIKLFKGQDPKNWTTADDVFLQEQITKNNADDTFSTYIEGGSTLIPVSVDNNGKEDKGTLLFLKWLYKQNVNYNGEKIAVKDLLTRKSAYFIPTKDVTDRGLQFYTDSEKQFKDKIAKNKQELEKLTDKDSKKEELQKGINQLTINSLYNQSGSVSVKSMLDFLKNTNEDILNLPQNEKTSEIISTITRLLLDSTLDNNPQKVTGEVALQKVLEIIDKKS
ncbi:MULTISPECIES: P68 family surface lipoprotein [unclassified Mycoplasma]|uniref:P68 family surface lipoprotein n=1 Tax=unclassified Mycoplasma TaxID=2683645 RepID=UPI00211D0645|nr:MULTISPECIES: hypothetical protein [unclassified Mycoplasma]UUM19899.1 hypothetical protein NPA11_00455 [Mycoplasma sp. 1578d]UUM24879.1 hypothetical protein NPA12_00435 [Mycoplasma sp. 3686d]